MSRAARQPLVEPTLAYLDQQLGGLGRCCEHRTEALTANLPETGARPMLTIWGAVIGLVAILVIVGAWWLTRDTTPPKPPRRHRPMRRDPHDPIRRDDEPPPDQP